MVQVGRQQERGQGNGGGRLAERRPAAAPRDHHRQQGQARGPLPGLHGVAGVRPGQIEGRERCEDRGEGEPPRPQRRNFSDETAPQRFSMKRTAVISVPRPYTTPARNPTDEASLK